VGDDSIFVHENKEERSQAFLSLLEVIKAKGEPCEMQHNHVDDPGKQDERAVILEFSDDCSRMRIIMLRRSEHEIFIGVNTRLRPVSE